VQHCFETAWEEEEKRIIDAGCGMATWRHRPLLADCLRRRAGRGDNSVLGQERPGKLCNHALVSRGHLDWSDVEKRTQWERGRSFFFAAGCEAMREFFLNHASRQKAAKRGGDRARRVEGEHNSRPCSIRMTSSYRA